MDREAFMRTMILFLTILHEGTTNPAVGFSAMLTHYTYMGDKQAVKYDRIITNYGNGYDKWSGHFTAPVKGLYVFSCTVTAVNEHTIHIDIVKNGRWISTIFSNACPWDHASETVVLSLRKGDRVWARQAHGGRHLHKYHNLFSGYLISTGI